MRRVISFSLYGDSPLYVKGMLNNIRLAPYIYPGWDVVIYADTKADAALHKLEPWKSPAEVILRPTPAGHEGMFWRFEAAYLPGVERAIFRDADSRLNAREKAAVDEWIADGSGAHVMRDHPHHADWPVLGGMWGLRAGAVADLESLMAPWRACPAKLDDMRFLAAVVWPRIAGDMTHHSSVFTVHPNSRPFPKHAAYRGFVGEIVAA